MDAITIILRPICSVRASSSSRGARTPPVMSICRRWPAARGADAAAPPGRSRRVSPTSRSTWSQASVSSSTDHPDLSELICGWTRLPNRPISGSARVARWSCSSAASCSPSSCRGRGRSGSVCGSWHAMAAQPLRVGGRRSPSSWPPVRGAPDRRDPGRGGRGRWRACCPGCGGAFTTATRATGQRPGQQVMPTV